jgi:sedoheptulose-bisphosphatase
MKLLKDYLSEVGVDAALGSVLLSLSESVAKIALAVNASDGSKAGSQNIYGEDQLALDVLSDKIVMDGLVEDGNCGLYGSEELSEVKNLGSGDYAVVTDPLDGSSLVDVNLSVGSIFGIYKTDKIIGVKGEEQVAAMIGVFGPSTTIFLTVRKGVEKFVLNDKGEFLHVDGGFKVGSGKMFAPGNLRACSVRQDYLDLVNFWCKNEYKLRYSGGMVPDINQILLKGMGVFAYPGFGDEPDGKLRLLYECAPMALIMEEAGGAATDGKMRILDKVVETLDQKSEIFIGSEQEVKRCEEFLN